MHGEKIVDGIPVRYLCQPCRECKAKLEATEEIISLLQTCHTWNIWTIVQAALSLWEKAGKGKP